jgi:Phosphate transporter family
MVATYFAIPVSKTHTITGAILGVGSARKTVAVRWNVANDVVLAWIVTLPVAAFSPLPFISSTKFGRRRASTLGFTRTPQHSWGRCLLCGRSSLRAMRCPASRPMPHCTSASDAGAAG